MSGDDETRGPPARPHAIHWRTPDEAAIEVAGAAVATVAMQPGRLPEVAILARPTTADERAWLFRCLLQAVEEYRRRTGSGGDRATAQGEERENGMPEGPSAPVNAVVTLEAVMGLALIAIFVALGLLAACIILELLHLGTF